MRDVSSPVANIVSVGECRWSRGAQRAFRTRDALALHSAVPETVD